MEITGTIKTVLPKTTGKTKKGKSWTAQQYVLETEGDNSVSILLEAFGQDNIDEYALTEGETVTVEYSWRSTNTATAVSERIRYTA